METYIDITETSIHINKLIDTLFINIDIDRNTLFNYLLSHVIIIELNSYRLYKYHTNNYLFPIEKIYSKLYNITTTLPSLYNINCIDNIDRHITVHYLNKNIALIKIGKDINEIDNRTILRRYW